MVKRPAIPIIVLIIVTVASLGVIATDPPSFDMDQNSFRPDNEITRAYDTITLEFASTTNVVSLVDAGEGGNIFSKDVFLSILDYERSLAMMPYTDNSGNPHLYRITPSDPDPLSLFRIYSPISVIAQEIAPYTNSPLEDPSVDLLDFYDTLIAKVSNSSVNDAVIAAAAHVVLENGRDGMKMAALLSKDYDPVAMTAKGCMVTTVSMESDLVKIQKGLLGFEQDVIAAAKTFNGSVDSKVTVKAAGLATMMSDIGTLAQRDISMLLPIAIAVIIVLLLLIYRDVGDTFIGLAGLLIAVVWTFGVSTLAGIEMTTIAIAVPILILALGIDYSLHLVFRYREERKQGAGMTDAIKNTMGSVGEALVLATVTTAIAFLSYLTSAMSALVDFGIMCAIGIVCAFAVMLLLVPPAQAIRGRRAEKKGKESKHFRPDEGEKNDRLGRISGVGGRMAAKRPGAALGVFAVIIVVFGVSAMNLSYSFDMYDFIPEGTDASETLNYLNSNFSATTDTTDILIYADGWDLDTLRAIELTLQNMDADPVIGLTYFGGKVYAEHLGTALQDLDSMLAVNPAAAALYPMYHMTFILLFDNEGRLRPWVMNAEEGSFAYNTAAWTLSQLKGFTELDPLFGAIIKSVATTTAGGDAITRVILHMEDTGGDNDIILKMRDGIEAADGPISEVGDSIITGQYIIMASSMKEMNSSQMTSLFVTIAFVVLILTIFMYWSDRSLLLGAMATVPTLISVIMVWGTMTVMGLSLNVLTLTIASLAVGMGVTYGIHISHRYVTELIKNDLEPGEAIIKATQETGKGVFAAAITTVAGFGVMGFSKILPLQQFGIITALAIAFGYIGSIFVLPSMLVIWWKRVKPRLMEKKKNAGKPTQDLNS